MFNLVKKTMLTGIGFALKTWDEVESKATEIAIKSKMSEQEGKKFVSDIRKRYVEVQDKMETKVENMVKEALKKENIATAGDIESLKNEINELKKIIK